jgi:UDP-GlcNAc3NAcA epimerase
VRIVSVVGTRPQYIKAAALSPWIRDKHTEVLVNSGQHYDKEMSANLFGELGMPKPDYNLDVRSHSHADMTALIMSKLDVVLTKEKPNMVLLYGDCDTTLASALVAAKRKIPIAHVEAGVRVRDGSPEEVNRLVTDHLSGILFAPSKLCVDNLAREGATGQAHLVGDIMCDLFLRTALSKRPNGRCYVTLHRESNVDNEKNLREIIDALGEIDIPVDFSVHPRTEARLQKFHMQVPMRIRMLKPLRYTISVQMILNASLVITDSGGVQREAYYGRTPCIVIGEDLAWPELKHWNVLVPPVASEIVKAVQEVRDMKKRRYVKNLLGDGHACEKIVRLL